MCIFTAIRRAAYFDTCTLRFHIYETLNRCFILFRLFYFKLYDAA